MHAGAKACVQQRHSLRCPQSANHARSLWAAASGWSVNEHSAGPVPVSPVNSDVHCKAGAGALRFGETADDVVSISRRSVVLRIVRPTIEPTTRRNFLQGSARLMRCRN